MERAAAAAGISEATLRRRMRDPEFQEETALLVVKRSVRPLSDCSMSLAPRSAHCCASWPTRALQRPVASALRLAFWSIHAK